MKNNHLKYWIRLLKIFFTYKRNKPFCNYKPTRLWIEINNTCNLKCPICPNVIRKNKASGYMNFRLFKKIIDQSKDFIKDVYLFIGGEPLLHPKLVDFINYAEKNGIRTLIHTNTTILNNDIARKLLKSKLSFVSFSVDGYDAKYYEKIRIGAKYEKTVENILNFLKLKKQLNGKVYTIIQTIEPNNFKDINLRKEFRKKFNNLPLDEFKIIHEHNYGGKIRKSAKDKRKYFPCTFLWYSMSVLYDGKIVPCCTDFFGDYVLGDVNKKKLIDVWNNNKMLYLRKKIVTKEYKNIKLCKDCDTLWKYSFFGIPFREKIKVISFIKEQML